MEAEECKVEPLTALNGICDGRSADYKTMVLYAWQILEGLQFCHELLLVLLCDIGSELEQNLIGVDSLETY